MNHREPKAVRIPSVPRVVVYPYYLDNPYTELLYRSVVSTGYDVVGVTTVDKFERAIADLGAGDVIHVQWTNQVAQNGRDAEDAWQRVRLFQRITTAAKKRGVALIWTVHNAIPHGTVHLEQEVALCRYLVDSADAVHVMNPATAAAVSDLYAIPAEKTVVIPHCSYLGVYPQALTRAEARERAGLGETDTAILFLGQMRPYKGLDLLLPAIDRLGEGRGDLVLMLAGKTNPADAAAIDELIPQNVRVIRHHAHIDDNDLQQWFRAADVVALPYRKILNSGSAMLAATFGVPVLLPDQPHLRAMFDDQPWVHFFADDLDGASLERALATVQPLTVPDVDSLRFASELSPAGMATGFQEMLERVRIEALAT